MIKSESITKIAPALAKAWAELENPKHNASVTVQKKSGGSYTFDYTDLGGILDEAKRVFKDNGISVMQNAHTEESESKLIVSVETMLLHSSGEWMQSKPLRMNANASIQDMGGQITYLKRYSLSAMLGIATEKDDDANGASGNDYQMNSNKASDKQLNYVKKLIKENVTEKYNEEQLHDLLKQRIETENDINNFTSQEASAAIKFLNSVGAV